MSAAMLSPSACSAFVWTRFGTEAGETIESILARKERERIANGGTFWWGIGNNVGRAIEVMRRELCEPPMVVFSPIVGKPRAIDVAPASTATWTRAEDLLGFGVKIPAATEVTSHGDRDCHYALVCHSDQPLAVKQGEGIDFMSLANFQSGLRLGASQTTAVVRRCGGSGGRIYRAALCVELAAPYFVRLTLPERKRSADPATMGSPIKSS